MVERSKLLLLAQIALGLLALAVLASGLSSMRLSPGEPINLLGLFLQDVQLTGRGDEVPQFASNSEMFSLLRQLFWIIIPFVIIYAIISPSYRRRLIRMAITLAIFLFAMSRLMDRMRFRESETEFEGLGELGEEIAGSIPTPPDYVTDSPQWMFVVINVVLALMIVAAILFVWHRFRPRHDAHAEVIREVERALASLEAGGNVDDVITQCYVDMTEVLRRDQRIVRRKAMTPSEFEQQLAEAGFSNEHIGRLTHLFERVRYSSRSAGTREEQEALSCLRAIVAAYGAPA